IGAVLLALAAAAPGASAQQRSCSNTAAAIYEQNSPGVVFIEGTSINPYRVTDRVEHIVGSGFIINTDGVIVTNSHVALGRQALSITLDNGATVPARLVAADAIFDIAVLQIPKPAEGTLPTLTLGDSDGLQVGEDVLAIGNPLGLSQTLTHGIVSAVNRVLPVTFFSQTEPMIQIDSPINHGNSGGPLLNRCGEVIGMTTAVIANAQGIGLAIPVNLIKQVLPALARDRRLIRPWLGFHGQFVDDGLKSLLNIPLKTGFLIEVIEPGSPAEAAPLQGGNLEMTIAGRDFLFGGDIVTRMNGRTLGTPDDVIAALATLKVGSEVTMTVFRDGKLVDLKYVLPERPLLPGDIMGSQGESWPMSARRAPAVKSIRF
ncbi:MAG TPA: trypsin-like peptidase domain-containing protein, partial [Candidatus Limnocylindrales bacterium]